MRRSPFALLVAVLIAVAGSVGYYGDDILHAAPSPAKLIGADCKIKGNVSIDTGERIYHVPGQKYYDEVVIRPEYDERWFCSEEDARAAGWRKSHV